MPTPLIFAHVSLVSLTGIGSYLVWRSFVGRFPRAFPSLRFCAFILEAVFVCYVCGLESWLGRELGALMIVCSLIGGKFHILSGGVSRRFSDAFHLLFLSAVTSFFAGVQALKYFPVHLRAVSISLATLMAVVGLAAPMATAFFWWMFHLAQSISLDETARKAGEQREPKPEGG